MTAPPDNFSTRTLAFLATIALISLIAYTPAPAQSAWERCNGPFTGKVLCFLQTGDGVVLAGTERGGIFSSSDGGDNWTYLALSGSAVFSLLELSDGRLLAGLDFSVQVSANSGATWTKTGLQTVQNTYGLAEDDKGTWYCGSWAGVHKSTDGGATWTESMSGLPNISVNDIAVNSAGTLYSAHQNRGLFYSTDGASSWQSANEELEAATVSSICATSSGLMFASTMGLGIYKSTDDGSTWAASNGGLSRFDMAVVYSSDGVTVYAGSATGRLYRSSDSGENWSEIYTTAHGEGILSIMRDDAGKVFAGTTWAGIIRSSDGGASWRDATAGLINISVPAFAMNRQGVIFMTNQTNADIMMSQDEGRTWSRANGGVYRNTRSVSVMQSNGFLYAGTARGVVHSTDNGATWYVDTVRMYNRDVRLIAVSPNLNIFVSCFGRKLYRSNDYGQNWSLLSDGLGGSDVICFAITPDGVVFAGTESAGLYRSDNNGSSWTNISAGMNRLLVTALHYSEEHGLFAGSYGEVHRSIDRGATWRRITHNLPVATVNAIVLSPRGNPTVGMEYRGVYYYDPDARAWTEANQGLDNTSILSFHVTAGGDLLAGTDGNGMYRISRIPSGISGRAPAAGGFTLMPAFPNPATQSTGRTVTLRFGDMQPGRAIIIRVNDMLGRCVIEHEFIPASPESTCSIPVSTLPRGAYYATARMGDAVRGAQFVVAD